MIIGRYEFSMIFFAGLISTCVTALFIYLGDGHWSVLLPALIIIMFVDGRPKKIREKHQRKLEDE